LCNANGTAATRPLGSGIPAQSPYGASLSVTADEIEVPEDELARETVYPVFDSVVAVRKRNVKDSKTIDIGLFGGFAITEPVYAATKFGLSLTYHLSEVHSIGVIFAKNTTGLSKDAQGLKDDFGLDFTRAPFPENSLLFDYNYKLYYGKLSVTKNGVINTSIYTSGTAGIIKYIHKSYPTIAFGVGERFYLTNNFALKVDLRVFVNNAPIPFKASALRDGSKGPSDPVPTYDSFSDRLSLTTNLELGLNYLF
jgi:outer membrane beta-barrel protein